jgi:hypothetical protein
MEMHLGVLLEPALVLFVRVEVVQDDTVHEAEELDATAPF